MLRRRDNAAEALPDTRQSRVYRTTTYRVLNQYGIAVTVFLGCPILALIGGTLLFAEGVDTKGQVVAVLMLVSGIGGFLLMVYPGNGLATLTIAIEVNESGLRIHAPFKNTFILFEEFDSAGPSHRWHIFEIRLHHRQGLLKRISISPFFGPEGDALIEDIRQSFERMKA